MENIFLEKLIKQYGEQKSNEIVTNLKMKKKVTFRVNTIKSNNEDIEQVLKDKNIQYEKEKFYDNAYIVENVSERELEELDIYKEGKIYLQSLSSMLPPLILNPKENMDILDMTAAPGGKTTEIAALTNNKANITACEMNNIRAQRLKYNIQKQGANSVYVLQKDARTIDDFFKFDQILLDAPCSGSGTSSFSENLIDKVTKIQLQLLKKALTILKPGSEMVYSTCSILEEENEEIVRKAIYGTTCELVPIVFEGMEYLPILKTTLDGTLIIEPTQKFEGFFVAKIKKLKVYK